MKKFLSPAVCLTWLASLFYTHAATAYEGMAKPWQLGFQPAATPVMEQLNSIHDFLLVIITVITIFVLMVMIYIAIRYRRKANPVPSKTTHNTILEITWTTIPILILVVIAIPSLRLHYYMQQVVEPDMTVKVLGYQWYWHYDYPDNGGFGFDSYIKKGNDLKPGDHRQLSVDNELVVPVDTKVRVLITAADVIHSWSVPAFGVKKDAVPGRLNETWFEATKIGTFYGQCSQLCGVGHGFMPIVVDVVSKDDFKAWVEKKKAEAGSAAPNAEPAVTAKDNKAEAPTPAAAKKKPAAPVKKPKAAASDDDKESPDKPSDYTPKE